MIMRPAAASYRRWSRAPAEVAAIFVLQLMLFQLAEEIGFTVSCSTIGRIGITPMKLTLYVELLWAVSHVPDHFAEEGWGLGRRSRLRFIFAIEFVSLFFARALFAWFYNMTAFSVLLVAIFHASFDASINQLSRDIVPASNTARFLIFSAVLVLAATIMIIATKGQLGRAKAATAAGSD
jgi:hypothetical protein